MRTQSGAVIAMCIAMAEERGYEASPFETDYKTVLKEADIKAIEEMTFAGINEGTIALTEKSQLKWENDSKGLRRYVTGLVNDRLRKAKALNANTNYAYKNPGKLTNSRDDVLKNLNLVLKIRTDPTDIVAIQEAIKTRQAEIAKAKAPEVDMSHLPADLVLFLNRDK